MHVKGESLEKGEMVKDKKAIHSSALSSVADVNYALRTISDRISRIHPFIDAISLRCERIEQQQQQKQQQQTIKQTKIKTNTKEQYIEIWLDPPSSAVCVCVWARLNTACTAFRTAPLLKHYPSSSLFFFLLSLLINSNPNTLIYPSSRTEESPSEPAPAESHLHTHSNENLLKMDTNDRNSTIGALKKRIAAELGFPTDPLPSPFFPGLQRMNKNPRNTYMFLAFDTPEHREETLQRLLKLRTRGQLWREVPVTEKDRGITYKGQGSSDTNRKRERNNEVAGSTNVAQFAHLSKEEQHDRKKRHCLRVMKTILPSNVYGWDTYAKRFQGLIESPEWTGYRNHVNLSFGYTADGTPGLGFWTGAMVDGCTTIISAVSPHAEAPYRMDAPNSAATSEAVDNNNRLATAGRADDNMGSSTEGVVTLHPIAREIAAAVMAVARQYLAGGGEVPPSCDTQPLTAAPPLGAGLSVFDKRTGDGFWRKVQIRHNLYGEAMVDVEVDEAAVPAEVFEAVIRRRLVEVLTGPVLTGRLKALQPTLYIFQQQQQHEGAQQHHQGGRGDGSLLPHQSGSSVPPPRIVSLQYHAHSGIRSLPPDTPRHVLYGDAHLTEYILGYHLAFDLGPTTFFQVNTPALSRMLDAVAEAAQLRPDRTTLLDLCSGVGTIGICLSRRVRRVIGIELVEEAVEHAKANVARNGVTNATYHAGRVEALLPTILSQLTPEEKEDVVAILDPPRAGVGSVVLKWIRGTPAIRTAIYISCEQKALERDCPPLTKPPTKAYRGAAFEVMSGFAVDMFPHTHHVEMVAVLRRKEETQEEEAETATEIEDMCGRSDLGHHVNKTLSLSLSPLHFLLSLPSCWGWCLSIVLFILTPLSLSFSSSFFFSVSLRTKPLAYNQKGVVVAMSAWATSGKTLAEQLREQKREKEMQRQHDRDAKQERLDGEADAAEKVMREREASAATTTNKKKKKQQQSGLATPSSRPSTQRHTPAPEPHATATATAKDTLSGGVVFSTNANAAHGQQFGVVTLPAHWAQRVSLAAFHFGTPAASSTPHPIASGPSPNSWSAHHPHDTPKRPETERFVPPPAFLHHHHHLPAPGPSRTNPQPNPHPYPQPPIPMAFHPHHHDPYASPLSPQPIQQWEGGYEEPLMHHIPPQRFVAGGGFGSIPMEYAQRQQRQQQTPHAPMGLWRGGYNHRMNPVAETFWEREGVWVWVWVWGGAKASSLTVRTSTIPLRRSFPHN
eukprot:gene11796-8107_t